MPLVLNFEHESNMDALYGYFGCLEASLNEPEYCYEKNRQLNAKNEEYNLK